MAKIKKIKLSGVTYDIYDNEAVHSETPLSKEDSGSGNVVTDIAVNNHKITVTKGETFATQALLNAEATARANADSSLSTAIGSVATNLASEVATRGTEVTRLDGRIDALEQRGRYLSGWNCSTGLPTTYPTIEVGKTYTYKSGDYYIVTVGGIAGDKMPKGAGITRTGESAYTVPTDSIPAGVEVAIGDTYTYDGTNFVLSHSADNNQTVKVGSVEFGPNDKVNFVGSGIVSVTGNASGQTITISASHQSLDGKQDKLPATGSANKPIYVSAAGVVSACSFTVDKSVPSDAKFTDTITSIASTTGSGNAVTAISADASGKLTVTKGETFAKASELHSHANKAILDTITFDSLFDLTGSDATKAKLKGIASGAQVNVIENVAIGSIQGSISSKVATFEAQAAGELAILDTVDASHITATIASNGSHSHTVSGTASGTVTIPTVSKTANKLVTTSIVPTNGSVNIIPAVANGSATLTVFGTDTSASKATAGTDKTFVTGVTAASLTGTKTFITSAIKSAAIDVKTSTATGYQAYVAAYTQPTFSGAGTYVKTITAPTLGGTTTFNTDAYKASYNSADECLELVAASTSTVTISGGTAASTGTISYSTGTVTTKYIGVTTTDCGADEKGTVGISGGTASGTDTITPYSFSDVVVPVVTSNDTVEVAKAGTQVSAAKVGSAVTVATGSLSSTGSGSDVTATISIGSSSASISATLSGSTSSDGYHNHNLA